MGEQGGTLSGKRRWFCGAMRQWPWAEHMQVLVDQSSGSSWGKRGGQEAYEPAATDEDE